MSKCCHWEPHPHYLKLKNNIFMQWPIYRNQKAMNGVCRGYIESTENMKLQAMQP